MIRATFAALLLAPGLAAAACYTNPESLVTYCTSAQECPADKPAWSAATQICSATPTSPPPEICTGTAAGSYKPEVLADPDRYLISAPAAMWARVGGVVRVDGKAYVSVGAPGPVEFGLTIPVPSTFDYFEDLVGTLTTLHVPGSGQVMNWVGGSDARFYYQHGQGVVEVLNYSYSYRIKGCH